MTEEIKRLVIPRKLTPPRYAQFVIERFNRAGSYNPNPLTEDREYKAIRWLLKHNLIVHSAKDYVVA